MRILREWLGGQEEIDLDTDEGWHYFAFDVTQDEEAAEELRARLERNMEVRINDDDPTYIERYTVIT